MKGIRAMGEAPIKSMKQVQWLIYRLVKSTGCFSTCVDYMYLALGTGNWSYWGLGRAATSFPLVLSG